jgi:hypothetical protein
VQERELRGLGAKDEAGRGLQSALESDVLWRGLDQDPVAKSMRSSEGEVMNQVQDKILLACSINDKGSGRGGRWWL